MAQKSSEYWAERARKDKIKVIKTGEQGIDNLKRILKTNLDDVQRQIKEFYEKYGDNPAEKLSYSEFEKYKEKLSKKAKQHPEDETLQKIAKQDIPKYKIDRLRALETDLQILLTEATAGQEAGIYKTLNDVGKVSQATLAKRFKDGFNIEFNTIASHKMKQLISSDWCQDKNWSDRIWADRKVVGEKLTEILEKGIPQGTSLQKMSRELKQVTGQSFNNAFRLIRTETSHIDGQVTLEGYRQAGAELGLEYYEYDAFLDSRTSKICRELDKKRFKVSEAEVGVNYPPMHPNCRSTTQLVLDEDYKPRNENVVNEIKENKEETPVLVEKGKQKQGSKIPNEFVSAKNYKKAEEYAKSLGIKTVEYKGLDLETANRMNKVYTEYSKKYPEIIQKMGYTGSHNNFYSYMKNKIDDDYAAKWLKNKFPDFSEEKIKLHTPYAKKELIKHFKPNKTARASSRDEFWGNIVTFNSKEKYKETAKNKGLEILHKFKPRATANVEGTIHHELGHQMDYLLNLRENKDIQKIYNSMTKKEITDNLSRYAWDNGNKNEYAEFIAEAWSEYNTSRKPRKIAQQVGKIIEEEYKKYKN